MSLASVQDRLRADTLEAERQRRLELQTALSEYFVLCPRCGGDGECVECLSTGRVTRHTARTFSPQDETSG